MPAAIELVTEPNEIICYSPTMITTNGIWQGDNPLDFSFPLFALQVIVIVITTRLLVYILRPIRQPRVIAEIMAGVLLGPSALGRYESVSELIFPLRSVMVLETMANIGLIYYLFLLGVEMDIGVIRQTGKKAFNVAIAGMMVPFITGCGFTLIDTEEPTVSRTSLALFLGIALAATAFPVLAQVLAELKLLNTEMGKVAMSSALINDIIAWSLLAMAIALTETDTSSTAFLAVVVSSFVFVAACVFVVRPSILWLIRKDSDGGERFNELDICLILTGVMMAAFVADSIGTHSIFGAFVFGLVIPNGPLAVALIDKIEDFVSGLLIPLFFAISGFKTNLNLISGANTWEWLVAFVTFSCLGKIGGTMVVSSIYEMHIKEGFSLGLLMNTKVLVTTSVIITGIAIPIVTTIYRPIRRFVANKRRTLQTSKPDSELRLITCVHTPRNVPALINLLAVTNPTRRSPLCVFVLHLVELTGRTSAMLIVHTRGIGKPALNRTQAQTDHIINAFENYERCSSHVTAQPLTVISPYDTMHEDVCGLAEEKRVTFMVVPFHKQQTVDGGMEAAIPAFRDVNQSILANAPCSVGIFVDRGLTGSTRTDAGNKTYHCVRVLFFGGPDDREALAYAWRISDNPCNSVNVIRFVARDDVAGSTTWEKNVDSQLLTIIPDRDNEKQLDEEYLHEFRAKTSGLESVSYKEMIVNNGEETVDAIRSLDPVHDMFIVGRGQGVVSPLTSGLTAWSECPELGAIGDLLASADFASTVSVLVVQQYVGTTTAPENVVGVVKENSSPVDSGGSPSEERLDPWQHVSQWKQTASRSNDRFNP
ncbi:hypothetical protein V2J09_009725 [Rumex salicifolius]